MVWLLCYTASLIFGGGCKFSTDLNCHVCLAVPVLHSPGLYCPRSLSSNINDQHSPHTATFNSSITSLLNPCSCLTWIALTSKGDNPSSKWEQITVVKFHSFCGIVESNREERFEKWERVRECWNPGGHFIAAHCFHHAGVTVTETSVRKTFSVARDQYSEEEWVQSHLLLELCGGQTTKKQTNKHILRKLLELHVVYDTRHTHFTAWDPLIGFNETLQMTFSQHLSQILAGKNSWGSWHMILIYI